MRPARVIGVGALLEPDDGVLADGVEHPKPGLAVVCMKEQAVVEERPERVEEVRRVADRLGRLDREAAGEDGESSEERLLLGL